MTPAPTFDADGYPTNETLDRIEQAPVREALDLARAAWHWEDWASEHLRDAEREVITYGEPVAGRRFIRFATGGWSGNESIISALNRNPQVRVLAWRLHARGGLHIYEYPIDRPTDHGHQHTTQTEVATAPDPRRDPAPAAEWTDRAGRDETATEPATAKGAVRP